MKTTFKKSCQLYPLHRSVLMMHVSRLMRDFKSLTGIRPIDIAEARNAAADLCSAAFRDAIKAGADREIAMSDLVGEVREIEGDLQGLAPVELARRVEQRLREEMPVEAEQPSTPGELSPASASVPETIDVASIRPRRGRKRSTQNLHPEVEGFLENVRGATGKTITIGEFCRVSNFGDDTVFGAWRRGDDRRCNPGQGNSFEKTLKLDPSEFLRRLNH